MTPLRCPKCGKKLAERIEGVFVYENLCPRCKFRFVLDTRKLDKPKAAVVG
jgi:phage FluMu protein Com